MNGSQWGRDFYSCVSFKIVKKQFRSPVVASHTSRCASCLIFIS